MQLVRRAMAYCIDHPVLANVSMVAIFILGYLACLHLPVQFLPDFNPDVLVVIATRDDASASEMKNEVMKSVDPHLYGLANLDTIEGRAREGVCFWVLRFEVGKFNQTMLDQVEAKLAKAKLNNVQYRVEQPRMRHPVLGFILWGPERLSELVALAQEAKRSLLSMGVDHVELQGVENNDIEIEASIPILQGLGLGIGDIASRLKQNMGDQLADSRYGSILPVKAGLGSASANQTVDQLVRTDIAGIDASSVVSVNERLPSQSPRVFLHNKPAISITINRNVGGSDIFSLQRIFKKWSEQFNRQWGETVKLKTYEETWRLLAFRIQLLLNNGAVGLVLIVALLGVVFHISLAKWIASGIPICIAVSCMMLYVVGGTVNFLSTFAFIMALGIIVDDTIVVAEQAYSEFQQGKSPREAVLNACQMMFVPIMAASMTTVASFVPLLTIPGEYGKIMIDIPRVIICVLIASILECFLILPRHIRGALANFPKRLPRWQQGIQDRLSRFQHTQLKYVLVWVSRHAISILSIGMVVIILPFVFMLSGRVPFSFFPSPPHDVILMDASFHAGVSDQTVMHFLREADSSLDIINKELSQPQRSIVQVPLQFTYQKAPKSLVKFNKGRTANHASMILGVSVPDQRQVTNQELIQSWSNQIPRVPFLKELSISEPRAGPPVPDIKILIKGNDSQKLKAASKDLQAQLAKYKGVHGIIDNMPYDAMTIQLKLKPIAKTLGVSRKKIEEELSKQLNHAEIINRYQNGDEVTVKIGLEGIGRERSGMLTQLPMKINGQMVTLGELVDVSFSQGFANYYSFNSQSGVLVTAESSTEAGGATTGEVIFDLQQKRFQQIEKEHNVEISLTTQARSQAKALSGIRSGAMIAVVMIYFILAWVLRSYTWPLMVMAVIPVGLSGAIWGHYILGMQMSILSIFGLFGLTGIVINDAIILLHRFQRAHKSRSVIQAMIHACCERFRAVILTSLTTIIGMGPLLMNKSLQAQFIIPLAVSVSAGLMMATVMLIVLLPAVTALIEPFCGDGEKV